MPESSAEQIINDPIVEANNADALMGMKQMFMDMPHRIGLINDIDEYLVHTVGKHVEIINRGARMLGFENRLPTEEEVIAHGGTAHYAGIFGMTPEDWEKIMIRERQSRFVNRKADIYHPDIIELAGDGANRTLLGFLTAKPGSRVTLQATQYDLFQRIGFPDKPLILKPNTVSNAHSSQWKVNILAEIAAMDRGKRLVLGDDSISTAKLVAQHNREQGYIDLIQVLYGGPLTVEPIKNGKYSPNEEEGIYYAESWDQIGVIFDRMYTKS